MIFTTLEWNINVKCRFVRYPRLQAPLPKAGHRDVQIKGSEAIKQAEKIIYKNKEVRANLLRVKKVRH